MEGPLGISLILSFFILKEEGHGRDDSLMVHEVLLSKDHQSFQFELC